MGSDGEVQQISLIQEHVSRCYKRESQNVPSLLLVARDMEPQALVVTLATLLQLEGDSPEVLLLLSNSQGQNFESQIQALNLDKLDSNTRTMVQWMEKKGFRTSAVMLDPRSQVQAVLAPILEWWQVSKKRVVIIAANLGTNNNVQKSIDAEELLIQNLQNRDVEAVESQLQKLQEIKSDSRILLQLCVRLGSQIGGGTGRVICYSDTKGWRRQGWVDAPGPEVTSYLGACWYREQDIESQSPILQNDKLQLVAFAHSVIASVVLKSEVPKLPSWSGWYKRKNGIFVGVSNSSGIMASVGHYEDDENTLPFNLVQAALNCVEDSISRWQNPITPSNIWSLSVDVKVLQPKSQWITLKPSELPSSLSPSSGFGFYLQLPSGRSATYLPSVWRERPQWTLYELLSRLSSKASADRMEPWYQSGSLISLYTVAELVECHTEE